MKIKSIQLGLKETFQIAAAYVATLGGSAPSHGFETAGYVYDRVSFALHRSRS